MSGGVFMAQAVERTGLTERQLGLMKRADRIRWRKHGRYLQFHEDDIAALERSSWSGRAIGAAPEVNQGDGE